MTRSTHETPTNHNCPDVVADWREGAMLKDRYNLSGEARHKCGERQGYCPECKKWVFYGDCDHKGKKYYTMKALKEALKKGLA